MVTVVVNVVFATVIIVVTVKLDPGTVTVVTSVTVVVVVTPGSVTVVVVVVVVVAVQGPGGGHVVGVTVMYDVTVTNRVIVVGPGGLGGLGGVGQVVTVVVQKSVVVTVTQHGSLSPPPKQTLATPRTNALQKIVFIGYGLYLAVPVIYKEGDVLLAAAYPTGSWGSA